MNTNTAITRQLMRIAGTLEAEWRQVLRGSVTTGQRMMSQVLSAFGLLDFTMLCPVLVGGRFETYETFICLIFPFFFGPR
jgi:hypothetical protein